MLTFFQQFRVFLVCFLQTLKLFEENICCFSLVPLHFNREMVFYNCQESPSKNFENMLTRPEILECLGALLGAGGSNDLAELFEV